jgi:hypothetical protein
MKCFSQWVGGVVAVAFLAAPAVAADAIATGKIKSVNADKKEFVLTDSAGKDSTFKLADGVVVTGAASGTVIIGLKGRG